jgi:hypothetical protein
VADEGIASAREIAAALQGRIQRVHASTQTGDIEAVMADLDGLR